MTALTSCRSASEAPPLLPGDSSINFSQRALRCTLAWVLSGACAQFALATTSESRCYGTVSNGRVERSVKLPTSGPNFTAYSALGTATGRTHVHSKVADIAAAYAAVERVDPSTRYVYGETGWPAGGRIRPHRTHENGLSVDFFVPVRNAQDQSVAIPTGATNRLGYDIEFDKEANYGEYHIDFPAMAERLYQLHAAAKARAVGIELVIFDTACLPRLFRSRPSAAPIFNKTGPS